LDAISDAAVEYVVYVEKNPSARDETGGSHQDAADTVSWTSFWQSFEASAKLSMRDAAESAFRRLVEGSIPRTGAAARGRILGIDVERIEKQGKIATLVISRPDGQPILDSPHGRYTSLTLRMREIPRHRWKIVEVREIDEMALSYTQSTLAKLGLIPSHSPQS
jgi:hypothetical protein